MIALLGRRPSVLSIREVGTFELGRLARLHRACFEEAWSRADLAHLLALPGGFGLIARLLDGGFAGLEALRGVGFAVCRVAADESELLSIGVAPPFRHRHIGSELLRASMARCRRRGAAVMFLEVATDNDAAQALYRAHGFACVGTRADYYQRADGSRASAYTMRCDLSLVAGEADPARAS